MKNFRYQKLI